VRHIFGWRPSHDAWRRLYEALDAEHGAAALLVHFRGIRRAPEDVRDDAREIVADAERVVEHEVPAERASTLLGTMAAHLRDEALLRVGIVESPSVMARLFVTTEAPTSAALLATVTSSLDDAAPPIPDDVTRQSFCGGAWSRDATPDAILAPLGQPEIDELFGPREATAMIRTPLPGAIDLPGLRASHSRTAPLAGRAGDDVVLGVNVHRGIRMRVGMDESARFRHTYVIGQTGTGKSTLLSQMILSDIGAGRGVAVLDPHGPLAEEILARIPLERLNDVVFFDVTDSQRPIGFNPLRIDEPDPVKYRRLRDLVIDDLHGYLHRTYSKDMLGPMFETHFRATMSMLLGVEAQVAPTIPNFIIFRRIYNRPQLRSALAARVREMDLIVDDFLTESENAGYDLALKNLAPYVTSKFTRFIADMALRNITCQRHALDVRSIVNEGKILIVYLGKGRFGDMAAGLLASQIVSRIRYEVMRRGAAGQRSPFYLYADEFQLFADQRFAELLAEARKFGLSLTLAHQYAEQLPKPVLDAVLGNVGTCISFRIGAQDASRFVPLFAPEFGEHDLTQVPNFRAYVRSTGCLGNQAFSLETLPLTGNGDPQLADHIRGRSRERYGRPRGEVEREIRETIAGYDALQRGG